MVSLTQIVIIFISIGVFALCGLWFRRVWLKYCFNAASIANIGTIDGNSCTVRSRTHLLTYLIT